MTGFAPDAASSAPQPADAPAGGREELAAAQRALVAALVAGGPLPPGFDAERVGAAARALLRKRAGEVARAWPVLAAAYGPQWAREFGRWASGRPTRGSWRDGWDFARAHRDSLPPAAVCELVLTEARWAYDGRDDPRPRRFGVRRIPGGLVLIAFGRVRTVRRTPN
ncbi:hypothetical protein SAMN04489712_101124 [Thermomonospora echinospora]|uniref:SCO6045-like C-terminal domain-containing protein n=1 Tax=Thermomonospora echinospora TaxID=1992 RepID=A0A1H5S9B1_9ACTN|nr:hypothetical protein [Thermomonospora echinospora]SEF47196.1 hypothetical protein SAMN04489712_101124 [Thermomonospora echinospora]